MVSGCDPGEPGVAGEGLVDGVDGADAVTAGAGEVGADAQVVAEGVGGAPVPGDGLVRFGLRGACSDALLVQGILKFFANSQICSALSLSRWASVKPGWLPLCQSRCRLVVMPHATAVS